jgi:acyl carrier protein
MRKDKESRMAEPALKEALKALIIETLRLEDIQAADIKDDEPLFVEGLGLDSIDALELVSAVEYKYGVPFPTDGTAKRHFASVAALADFIDAGQRHKAAAGVDHFGRTDSEQSG